MLSEQQQRIMGYFIEEAKDHLNTIEQGLVNLQATIADSEMVHEVFRAAHSVKGGAAMLGLTSIQQTAHRLEDYFKVLKECPGVKVDQKLETLFLRVYDTLHELVEQLQGPFGLTDDKAAEAMATVEPVFNDLNQHLNFLVDQAGGTPPEDVNLVAAVVVAPKPPVPVSSPQPAVTEASALSFIFQNDVPARLRDMLQLFKQAETAETRAQLQEICRVLAQPGEQFDIPQWCNLLTTAQRAIGNAETTYRSLAPVIIKDVKRAQELVLSGRSNEIFACDELVRLLPPDEPVADVSPDLDLADLFTDLDQIGDESDLPDLIVVGEEETVDNRETTFGSMFDLPSLTEESFSALDAPFTDQEETEAVTLDEPDFDLFADEEEAASTSDDWFLDSLSDESSTEPEIDILLEEESDATALDFALNFEDVSSDATNAAGDLDDFDLIDRLDDAEVAIVPEHNGPEVGAAELNSLADLFEGEMPDLGLTWQEEQVISNIDIDDQTPDIESSSDFSDLLLDSDNTDNTEDLVLDDTEDEDLSGLLDAAALHANRASTPSATPQQPEAHASEWAEPSDLEIPDLEISDLEIPNLNIGAEQSADTTTEDDLDLFLFADESDASISVNTQAGNNAGNLQNLDDLFAGIEIDELASNGNEASNVTEFSGSTDEFNTLFDLPASNSSDADGSITDEFDLDESGLDESLDAFDLNVLGLGEKDLAESGAIDSSVPAPSFEINLGDADGTDISGSTDLDITDLDIIDLDIADPEITNLNDASNDASLNTVDDADESDLLIEDLFDNTREDSAALEDETISESASDLENWFDTASVEPNVLEDEPETEDEPIASDAFNQFIDLSAELSAEPSVEPLELFSEPSPDPWTEDELVIEPSAELSAEPSAGSFNAEFDLFQDSTVLDLDSPFPEANDSEDDSELDDLLAAAELSAAETPEFDLASNVALTSAEVEEVDALDSLFDTQNDVSIDPFSTDEEVDLGELFGAELDAEDVSDQPLSGFEAVLASEVDLDLLDASEAEPVTSLSLGADLDTDLDTDLDADLDVEAGTDLFSLGDDPESFILDEVQAEGSIETPFEIDAAEFSLEESASDLPEIRLEESEFDAFALGDTSGLVQAEGSDLSFSEDFPTIEGATETEPTEAELTDDGFADLDAILGADLAIEDPVVENFATDDLAAMDGHADGAAELSELDDFADLEAMLANDSSTPANTTIATDDFADLEALLGDNAPPPVAPTPVAPVTPAVPFAKPTVAEDEFGDLEALLQDADQKLGVGSSPVRSAASAAARRPTRRNVIADQTMRVSVKHLDNLNNLVGELVVNRNSLEQTQERLRQFLDNLLYQVQQLSDVGQRMRDLYERSLLESSLLSSRRSYHLPGSGHVPTSQTNHATGASFDALEMDRFTGFHTLSQSMIELIVRVRESASDIDFVVEESDQVTRNFRQITTQLQEGLTRSRMVPFAQTADRLPRGVRDNAIKYGKQAELTIEGRDTLIDKMIVEQLYDPMTHLVNNAVAHGIETPEERIAAGKPPTGKITIRAFHQGNQTVISVSDDGAGINPDRVKAKAVAKGLITAAEAEQMSRLDTYDLLFHHGFSTVDQVDDLRGRGVGLDVVRNNLSEIRGVITIDSGVGKGTTFTIRLPLTLSISKALCCISNRARIAFPMDGVEDMLDVPKERIMQDEQGRPCIQWRDTLLPFQPLAELLKYSRILGRSSVYGGNQEEDMLSVVVLRSAGSYLALQVDQVLGEQEIVIKQLEGPVPKPIGVAGATVLGDGRIMPIADVLELIDLSQGRIRREANNALWEIGGDQAAIEAPAKTESTVLIVDDSITVRELLSMTFNKVGYRVEQARDGQEAWEKLRSGLPCDLVFCDIEMPRMDGLELLSRIQKDPHLNQLPIAMLTSRGADRHRQMAIQLGARGYFTKPYLEEMLLDAAQRMLKGEVLVTSSAAS